MSSETSNGKERKEALALGIAPKLRFPEFRGTKAWLVEPFGSLYIFKPTNSLSRDQLTYEDGHIKNIHYGDIHTRFSPLFDLSREVVPYISNSISIENFPSDCFCREGDMVFADASEDTEGIGKCIEIVRLHNQKLLSGMHTLLARQKSKRLINGFGGHLFQSWSIRRQVVREAQGAKVLGISAKALGRVLICYPMDQLEQSKIADCLSSLDELIAAEKQRLDALKAHKKGLMQQLFPAEGETTPRLRFPEFHASPEWTTKPLGDLVVYENGKAYEPHISEYGRFTVVNSRFISSEGTIRKQSDADLCIANQGDVLMVLSDLPKGKALAKCFYVDLPNHYAVNQRVCRLTPHRIDSEFLYYALNRHPALLAYDDGLNQTHLRKDAVLACPIPLSNQREEQRRVADCLSAFDKLLALQRVKIIGLVGFKAGLMQQLFPSMDEVQA